MSEAKITEVAKRYAIVGIQTAQAYNAEQAKLDLGIVLSQSRLSSTDGTAKSLATLSHLAELTAAHKKVFQQFVASLASEMASVISEQPPEAQAGYRERFFETANRQLQSQSEFYRHRERWIVAATALCNLIEARRATSIFSEAGVTFADDRDYETFDSLLRTIEEVHQIEVASMKETMDRIARSAAVLGLQVRG